MIYIYIYIYILHCLVFPLHLFLNLTLETTITTLHCQPPSSWACLSYIFIHHSDLKPNKVQHLYRWCIGTWTVLGCNKCAPSMRTFTSVWHCGTTTADRPWFQTSAFGPFFQLFALKPSSLGENGCKIFRIQQPYIIQRPKWRRYKEVHLSNTVTDMHWRALTRYTRLLSCWGKKPGEWKPVKLLGWEERAASVLKKVTKFTIAFEKGTHQCTYSQNPRVDT